MIDLSSGLLMGSALYERKELLVVMGSPQPSGDQPMNDKQRSSDD
jgi:hypothetical protein